LFEQWFYARKPLARLAAAPPPPRIVRPTTATLDGLRFTFSVVDSRLVAGYHIYRAKVDYSAVAERIAFLPQPPHIEKTVLGNLDFDDTVPPEQDFFYWVASVNGAGQESARVDARGESRPSVVGGPDPFPGPGDIQSCNPMPRCDPGSIIGGYTNSLAENYFVPFGNGNSATPLGTVYKNPIACFLRNLTAYCRATVAENELISLNFVREHRGPVGDNTVQTDLEVGVRSGEPAGSYLGTGAWSRLQKTGHIQVKRAAEGTNTTLFSGWSMEVVPDQSGTSFLGAGSFATITASTTIFFSPYTGGTGGSTVEGRRVASVPYSGSVHTLFIQTSSAQPATGSLVITIRKNGAGTVLTKTIAAGLAAGYFHVLTSFGVVDGDQIVIEITNNATTASAGINTIGFCLTASNGTSVLLGGSIHGAAPSATSFFKIYQGGQEATENIAAFPMPRAGVISNFSCLVPVGFEGNNKDTFLRLRKNGSTVLTITVGEAVNGRFFSGGSVPFVRGDWFTVLNDELDHVEGPPRNAAEIATWSAKID